MRCTHLQMSMTTMATTPMVRDATLALGSRLKKSSQALNSPRGGEVEERWNWQKWPS